MEPGEIVVEVQVPAEEPSEGLQVREGGAPGIGLRGGGRGGARARRAAARLRMARIGVTGTGAACFPRSQAEKLLEGGADVAAAAAVVGEGEEANSDLYASAEYRRHLAQVHAARAHCRRALEGVVKIAGTYLLQLPQERAYALLQDPGDAGAVHAGLRKSGPDRRKRIRHAHEDGAASVSGLFDGKVTIADVKPPASYTLIVEGTGKIGFMKGEGLLTLTPEGDKPRCSSRATCRWAARSRRWASA